VKLSYQSNSSITAFEATSTRALFQVIFNQIIMTYLGLSYKDINRDQMKKLFMRFAIGYPAWTMLFYSVKVLPIGLSQTIQNLQPFLTLIFAFIILRESVKRLELYNMIAAFMGVLIMVGMSSSDSSYNTNNPT
jgi:drug/metabolite transporter (DMT)-like permease